MLYAPEVPAPAPWKSYLIFTLCASLYLLPFMRIVFVARDEGSLLIGAARIVHGQVFARDFFEAMGPGTFYWLAAFFKLFGVSFLASRVCLFVSSLGTALSIYFLTRQVCGKYQLLPSLIIAGTFFGALWPGIGHHIDSLFFSLLAIVCLVFWNSSQRKSLVLAAGFLAGVTTCIFLPRGVLLFCALSAWLWLQRRKTADLWPSLCLLSAGFLAIVSLTLAYFWSQGALSSLVYANFIFPRQHYYAVNAVVYASGLFSFYWKNWFTAFGGGAWSFAIAAVLIAPFLFIAALPLLILFIGIRYKWSSVRPEIALYWLCGWSMWLSEIHRSDIWHLVCGSPLLIILFIYALSERKGKLAQATVRILAISSMWLSSFNCCVVLAMGAHSTATRVGNVVTAGTSADQVLRFIDSHIAPGEEIFVYPYCSTYYFLSAATNPTRYSFLMYNYNTPAQFQEVIDILERRRIRYVLWETTFMPNASGNFPGMLSGSSSGLLMEPYLESHYKLVEDDHGVRIMERKDDNLAK